MKAPFFIEVLSRSGEVRLRQRVDALPIHIGRGYDNNFILDDRHTSAHHVLVQSHAGDGLEAVDLGSRNGIVHNGKRLERLTIDGNTVFRLGHTSLRIRSADFSVASEMQDTTRHNWEGWPPALTGLLLLALLTVADTWLSDSGKADAADYLSALLGVLGLTGLWCGGWAMANRVFSGQTRFGRHLFIAASGMTAIQLAAILLGATAYAFSLESLSAYGSHLLIALAAGMVLFHLLTINPNNPRRYATVSAALALLGSGMTLTFNYQGSGHLADRLYMEELLPPLLRVSPDAPLEQFLDEARQLKEQVDAERNESPDGEEG